MCHHRTAEIESEMQRLLELVGIGFLVEREGGWDSVRVWEDTLRYGSVPRRAWAVRPGGQAHVRYGAVVLCSVSVSSSGLECVGCSTTSHHSPCWTNAPGRETPPPAALHGYSADGPRKFPRVGKHTAPVAELSYMV